MKNTKDPIDDTVEKEKLVLDPVSPIELAYKNIQVDATVEVDD